MLIALLRFSITGPLSFAFVVLTWFLSPLLALISMPFANLPFILYYLQTHDAPLDALWQQGFYTGYTTLASKTVADFQASFWLRCYARMLWLIRNPADALSFFILGFNTYGTVTTTNKSSGVWDSGSNNWAWTVMKGPSGRAVWSFNFEWFYTSTRFVRARLGWKLDSGTQTAMVVLSINPVRKFVLVV